MTVRVRAAVRVDDPADIDRPGWVCNELLPEGRELHIAVQDLLLVLSERVSAWLLAMLEVMVAAASEADDHWPRGGDPPDRLPGDRPGGPTRVTAYAFHPGEVSRPRWDGRELVVTLSSGDVVLILGAAAAGWLVDVLRMALNGR